MEVLTNPSAVIIWQQIYVLNHYVVCFKLIQSYMSYLNKDEKKEVVPWET